MVKADSARLPVATGNTYSVRTLATLRQHCKATTPSGALRYYLHFPINVCISSSVSSDLSSCLHLPADSYSLQIHTLESNSHFHRVYSLSGRALLRPVLRSTSSLLPPVTLIPVRRTAITLHDSLVCPIQPMMTHEYLLISQYTVTATSHRWA